MRRPQVEPELAGVRDQERRVLAHVGDEPLREEVAASLPVGAGEQGLLVTDEERDRRADQLGQRPHLVRRARDADDADALAIEFDGQG